ncbi:MAG: hypothetical protein LLF94_07335 [Chlamydiales bacterium]|nr:hypothetical protein [Chlamydiales bacterium]
MNVGEIGSLRQAHVEQAPQKEALVEAVATQRVHALAYAVFGPWKTYGEIGPILDRHFKPLVGFCKQLMSKWSESELQEYRSWQESPLTKKIHAATESAKIQREEELDKVLNPEELKVYGAFKISHLGQLKMGMDQLLKNEALRIIEACRKEIDEKYNDARCY